MLVGIRRTCISLHLSCGCKSLCGLLPCPSLGGHDTPQGSAWPSILDCLWSCPLVAAQRRGFHQKHRMRRCFSDPSANESLSPALFCACVMDLCISNPNDQAGSCGDFNQPILLDPIQRAVPTIRLDPIQRAVPTIKTAPNRKSHSKAHKASPMMASTCRHHKGDQGGKSSFVSKGPSR